MNVLLPREPRHTPRKNCDNFDSWRHCGPVGNVQSLGKEGLLRLVRAARSANLA